MGLRDRAEIVSDCDWYDADKMDLTVVSGNLKDAGTHKIKVTLTAGNKVFEGTPGEGESETERFFTLTINPLKVTPPTVSDTTQTYSASGNVFTITGFDSAKMSVTGLTPNNGKFEVTSAGDYTVTFALKDKTNYQWNDGKTDDVEIPLKVTPVSLTAPS